MTQVRLIVTRFGLIVTRVGSTRLLRYQHVGILNTKFSRWVSRPKQDPNVKGFALQWNVGFNF